MTIPDAILWGLSVIGFMGFVLAIIVLRLLNSCLTGLDKALDQKRKNLQIEHDDLMNKLGAVFGKRKDDDKSQLDKPE